MPVLAGRLGARVRGGSAGSDPSFGVNPPSTPRAGCTGLDSLFTSPRVCPFGTRGTGSQNRRLQVAGWTERDNQCQALDTVSLKLW